MAEESYRELERKARVRHYGTILFKRLNGESVEAIAKSLKMEEASILRCLAWAEKNWSRIISPNGEEHTTQETSSTPADQMGKTSCARCNETIHAGQYRVVLSRVEMKPPDIDRGIPLGRGLSFYESYCDSCVAEIPLFEVMNPWKMLSDNAARPSAGPATEDAAFRSVSVQEIAEKFADDGPGDGEALDEADIQANVLSSDAPTWPLPELAGEAAQRARLLTFLNAPASRGMRSDMRAAAKMWVEGASQSEVARKLGRDQSTVSRMIAGARKMAYARG
jgi:Helix-turn-helix domain